MFSFVFRRRCLFFDIFCYIFLLYCIEQKNPCARKVLPCAQALCAALWAGLVRTVVRMSCARAFKLLCAEKWCAGVVRTLSWRWPPCTSIKTCARRTAQVSGTLCTTFFRVAQRFSEWHMFFPSNTLRFFILVTLSTSNTCVGACSKDYKPVDICVEKYNPLEQI